MRSPRSFLTVLAPVLLVGATALAGSLFERSTEIYFINALVAVSIVVALYVFVGNSGVVSFGHIAFVAVGAWTAGVLSVPVEEKPATMPSLYGFLGDTTVGNLPSLLLAALVGGVFALVAGLPLMRLSGLAAGIGTFAVLGITQNIVRNWEKIGPGPLTLSTVPETTDLWQATVGAVAVACVAFAYQRSSFGRRLRAAREDPFAAQAAGIDIHRQRLWAFALSGALSGFAGGLFVHYQGTINVQDVFLDFTFLSLAMLVVGGVGSLWGAVVGALLVSGLDSFLSDSENDAVSWLHVPDGTRTVVVAAFMAVVVVFLPRGLTGGREFSLPALRRRRASSRSAG